LHPGYGGGVASLGKIDLNVASIAELCTLPGIGRGRAERIIQFRVENGPLAGAEALLAIQGIGRSVVSRLSGLVA
jgi:competence protein ComEA